MEGQAGPARPHDEATTRADIEAEVLAIIAAHEPAEAARVIAGLLMVTTWDAGDEEEVPFDVAYAIRCKEAWTATGALGTARRRLSRLEPVVAKLKALSDGFEAQLREAGIKPRPAC